MANKWAFGRRIASSRLGMARTPKILLGTVRSCQLRQPSRHELLALEMRGAAALAGVWVSCAPLASACGEARWRRGIVVWSYRNRSILYRAADELRRGGAVLARLGKQLEVKVSQAAD